MNFAVNFVKAPLLSPAGMLRWAVAIALFFAGCFGLGLSRYTSALSLTWPEGSSPQKAILLCMVYLAAWALFTLVMPVLLIASGLAAGLAAVLPKRPPA